MVKLVRTNSDHCDFIALVRLLDAELTQRDGAEHAYYARYNKIEGIPFVVVSYEDARPVGCGAIKAFDADVMEVKRMYTMVECRGKGMATKVLGELEKWAAEMNYKRCVLETGKRQPEAIKLYQGNGYVVIPNYGQYAGMENSVCFEKMISR